MRDLEKTIRLGVAETYGGRSYSVYCQIRIVDGELSITGVEGPLSSGNALGSCGQIEMSLDITKIRPAPGWTHKMLREFLTLWRRWHLNEMTAGSPAQEAWLRDNPVRWEYPESHYTAACTALAGADINPDPDYLHDGKPYHYGTAWLKESLPVDVVEWLRGLPDADKTPAWV